MMVIAPIGYSVAAQSSTTTTATYQAVQVEVAQRQVEVVIGR